MMPTKLNMQAQTQALARSHAHTYTQHTHTRAPARTPPITSHYINSHPKMGNMKPICWNHAMSFTWYNIWVLPPTKKTGQLTSNIYRVQGWLPQQDHIGTPTSVPFGSPCIAIELIQMWFIHCDMANRNNLQADTATGHVWWSAACYFRTYDMPSSCQSFLKLFFFTNSHLFSSNTHKLSFFCIQRIKCSSSYACMNACLYM